MTTVCINQLHAWNIGVTVPDIYHIAERNTNFLGSKVVVYSGIIYIKGSFYNSK